MPDVRPLLQDFATVFYRQAAMVSARMLASSPIVESVMLHRSAATGEVCFGRSDIDLLMVVSREAAENEGQMDSLYRRVRRLQAINPALNHIETHEPGAIEDLARMDTFWASLERRAVRWLWGRAVEIPFAPVEPDHALARFLLWAEWFFAISVQRQDRRNLWKTSLENWNAYATAEGLIPEPYLLRSEMEAHLRGTDPRVVTRRLEEASYAAAFVFELADRMHRARLPALRMLAKPLIFEAIMAPLGLRRLFVVLPRADVALPPEAFEPGAFPCTPELLHLYFHFKNAFLYWVLPAELLDLGMAPPSVSHFLRDCRYYGHGRFLFTPGFSDAHPPAPAARMACLRHALEWAARGHVPPPIPQEKLREVQAGAPRLPDYYRAIYGPLRRESQQFQRELLALTGPSSCRTLGSDPQDPRG